MTKPLNIFVTGIPRSGTTLTASIIDNLEDSFCICEPRWQNRWSREHSNRSQYINRLVSDFNDRRKQLLAGEAIEIMQSIDGTAITDYFENVQGQRRRVPVRFTQSVPGHLSKHFLLAMKHNAHYSCVLPELVELPGFSIMVIIRDPTSVLLSWRSVNLPISRGRIPAAENYWPEIRKISDSNDELLLKQVKILELFFERYHRYRKSICLIRYEEIINDQAVISQYLGRKLLKPIIIRDSHVSKANSDPEIGKLKELVRDFCPIASTYYPE